MKSPWMNVWDVVVVTLATLAAVVIPLELVPGLQSDAGLFVFELLLTIIFSLDILFTFRQTQVTKTTLVPSSYPRLIFTADIIAAVPFALFHAAPALLILRLLKFARVVHIIRRYWRRNLHHSLVLRIGLFHYGLGITTHWFACGWLALRGMDSTTDVMANYIAGAYFCVSTLTTVGFGDVTPVNSAERLFVIGMMLFGVGVYGFVIGNIASMLLRINPARAHHVENMEKLDAFMRYKSLPARLRKRLVEYYVYLWEQRLGYDESSILSSLPPSLKTEVSLYLKRDIIQKVPLFKDAGEGFIKEIALLIVPFVYMPGDYVVVAGDAGREMYFVSRGELEVVSKDGRTIFATLRDGDFFGEIALVLKEPRTASVRAITYCDLYRLDRESFERVLDQYPDVAAKIGERATERRARE